MENSEVAQTPQANNPRNKIIVLMLVLLLLAIGSFFMIRITSNPAPIIHIDSNTVPTEPPPGFRS